MWIAKAEKQVSSIFSRQKTLRIVREIEASWIRACAKCKIPYAILLFNVNLFLGPRPSAWLFTSLGSLNVPGKAEFRLRCKRDLDTKIEVALLVFRWMAGHISKVTMTPGSLMWHQLARFNRPKRTEQRNNYKLGTPRNEIAEFFEWIHSIYCRFLSSLSMFFVGCGSPDYDSRFKMRGHLEMVMLCKILVQLAHR